MWTSSPTKSHFWRRTSWLLWWSTAKVKLPLTPLLCKFTCCSWRPCVPHQAQTTKKRGVHWTGSLQLVCADLSRAELCARQTRHPPRHQNAEYIPHRQQHGQDRRLRNFQSARNNLPKCEHCRRYALLYGAWSLLIGALHVKVGCLGARLYPLRALHFEETIWSRQLAGSRVQNRYWWSSTPGSETALWTRNQGAHCQITSERSKK